jgi:hypothetical protein
MTTSTTTTTANPEGPVRRPFGRSAPVSLFTLGTMRALEHQDQLEPIVARYLAAGGNHFETAPAYGPAQRYLGRALRRLAVPRSAFAITSKLLPGVGVEEGWSQLQQTLDQLGLQRLDNLAVHGLNRAEHLAWALDGAGAELLQRALQQNLVDQVGFSSHGDPALIEQALDSGRFGFASLHLHLFDPRRLPLAARALAGGLGVMAISPADKGGLLHRPSPELVDDCQPFHPLELAYRVLLARGISTLTVGASRPEDLIWVETLAGRDGPLTAEEQQSLERLEQRRHERLGSSECHQCRACLPCPREVPIPELLRLRNLAVGHGMEAHARERYGMVGQAGHWFETVAADACRRCQDCLPRCPHALPIPELLADTHRRLAAPPRRRLWG